MSSNQRTSVLSGSGHPTTTVFTTTETVSGGTRERAVVETVKSGDPVVAGALSVSTVEDPAGDFDVALFNGDDRVTPRNETHTMNVDELSFPATAVYTQGDDVTVELDARDRTNPITVSVLVPVAVPQDLALRRDALAGME
jgi:hypothetical protein